MTYRHCERSEAISMDRAQLGSGLLRRSAPHDKPVLFLHPKDFSGTLIELEQA